MLQRVRAGRDLPVDWLNIYGEGDGEACLWGNAKRTDSSSETTPWGQRKILLPLSSSALQMSILYPACECPYYAACVVFIIHSRSRCITVVSIFTTTYTEMLPIRGLVQHVWKKIDLACRRKRTWVRGTSSGPELASSDWIACLALCLGTFDFLSYANYEPKFTDAFPCHELGRWSDVIAC